MDFAELIFPYLSAIQTTLYVVSTLLLLGAFTMLGMRVNALPEGTDFSHKHVTWKEKRQVPRFVSDGAIDFEEPNGGMLPGAAALINLSSMGASFLTRRSLKIGQSFVALLRPAHRSPMRVIGQVIWLKPKANLLQCGVKFKTILPDVIKNAF